MVDDFVALLLYPSLEISFLGEMKILRRSFVSVLYSSPVRERPMPMSDASHLPLAQLGCTLAEALGNGASIILQRRSDRLFSFEPDRLGRRYRLRRYNDQHRQIKFTGYKSN
jgi:hypothetical protein